MGKYKNGVNHDNNQGRILPRNNRKDGELGCERYTRLDSGLPNMSTSSALKLVLCFIRWQKGRFVNVLN